MPDLAGQVKRKCDFCLSHIFNHLKVIKNGCRGCYNKIASMLSISVAISGLKIQADNSACAKWGVDRFTELSRPDRYFGGTI